MTRLADNLFNNMALSKWQEVLQQQSTPLATVTYHDSQFTISDQQKREDRYEQSVYLSLVGPRLSGDNVIHLLRSLNPLAGPITVYPPTEYNGSPIVLLGFPPLTEAEQEKLTRAIKGWSHDFQVDFALTATLPSLAEPGLVLMDMDSTTIQIECIDEIAKLAGVGEAVAAVTARAMNGEIDFATSLRSRVATLKDCPEGVLKQVADAMPLMPGLTDLIAVLKQANWRVAIASGGFTYFADRLKADHGFDAAYANKLGIEGGMLTGKVVGGIVDAQVKADTLHALADLYRIPPSQTVAIGDGANDLLMLSSAALGVALHAKPVVQEQAAVSLNYHHLEGVIALLISAGCQQTAWT